MGSRALLRAAILCGLFSVVLWIRAAMIVLTYPWQPDTSVEFLAVMLLILSGSLGVLWWVARKDGA